MTVSTERPDTLNVQRRDPHLLYVLIFLSGFAALIYELLWMRKLHLIFGVSSFAVATVLAAYMLGLALGSALFGRISERARDLMSVYVLIEIGTGLAALGSWLALENFHLVERFYYDAYAEAGLYVLSLVRLVLCLAILILPTVLIGGTIPVVTKFLISADEKLGSEFSTIYYVNALGAVVGVVATGFLLIRWLGVGNTYVLAIVTNVAVGLAALRLRGSSRSVDPAPGGAERASMLAVLFLTGFIVFGYEIVWLRLISIYGRATSYSLTVVLAGFLAGISLGSFVFSRRADRMSDPFRAFHRWALASAALGLVTLLCFANLGRFLGSSGGYAMPLLPTLVELLVGFALSAAVAFPFGGLFPLALRIYAGGRGRIGSWTGSAYAVNTCGAICGSLFTGFVLVPVIGLQRSVVCFIALQLLIAVYGFSLDRQPGGKRGHVLAYLAVGAAAFSLLVVEGKHYRLKGPQDELLAYEEGLSGTVTVLEYPGPAGSRYRELLVDSEPVAATYPPDVIDAKLLAHIPLLLHPDPSTAVTVGFGSGGTSHSMRLHGVEVTAVEIEEAVVRANRFFQENSFGILDKSRFRLVLDDARSFMLSGRESYDVIVTDVTNLKYKGNPSLYSVEYFALMRDRLAPDGIAAAWVPLGGASYRDLQILLASFHRVFPHTTVWFYSLETTHFLVLVGTETRLSVVFDELQPAAPVSRDLAGIGIRGTVIFASMILLGEDDVARVVDGVPLHTDGRPVLEFSDMRSYLLGNSTDNLRRLLEHGQEDLATYFEAPPSTVDFIREALRIAEKTHRKSIRHFEQIRERGVRERF